MYIDHRRKLSERAIVDIKTNYNYNFLLVHQILLGTCLPNIR